MLTYKEKRSCGRTVRQKKFGSIVGFAYGGMGLSMGILTPLMNKSLIPSQLAFALALIPILCVWAGLWAHGKLILELDEYLRFNEVKILLFAIVFALALATGWGYLEFFWGKLPHLPMILILPVFYVFYAIGHGIWSRDSLYEE